MRRTIDALATILGGNIDHKQFDKYLKHYINISRDLATHLLELEEHRSSDTNYVQNIRALSGEIKINEVSSERLELFKMLELIEDYSSRAIFVGKPMDLSTVTSVFLECHDEYTRQVLNKSTLDSLDFNTSFNDYISESNSFLGGMQTLSSQQVYLSGPIFYHSAQKSKFTMTFSSGSGLPNPMEWYGPDAFCERFGIDILKIPNHLKKPQKIRSINFMLGICNPSFDCHNVYIWQKNKTSREFCQAYELCFDFGMEEQFICRSYEQLNIAFTQKNLKIIEVDEFTRDMKRWTRISRDHLMSSKRSGRWSEIDSAVWFGPRDSTSSIKISHDTITNPIYCTPNDLSNAINRAVEVHTNRSNNNTRIRFDAAMSKIWNQEFKEGATIIKNNGILPKKERSKRIINVISELFSTQHQIDNVKKITFPDRNDIQTILKRFGYES